VCHQTIVPVEVAVTPFVSNFWTLIESKPNVEVGREVIEKRNQDILFVRIFMENEKKT
jgi:hypothetical protein